MAYLNTVDAYADLKHGVLKGIQANFPLEGKKQSIHLEGLTVRDEKFDPDDIEAQHHARMEGRTWSSPVIGQLVLKDNATGNVIDRQHVRLADIPHMTRRYSYIVDGKEVQVDNQWQLKPGVYTRRRANGELETQFNSPSRTFHMHFDPDTKIFHMERGKSGRIPAYPLMKAMGIDDDTLEKQWGKPVLQANQQQRAVGTALERFFKADRKRAPESKQEAIDYFHQTMRETTFDPESTEITLGHPHTNVTADVLTRVTKKMLDVQNGHVPEDERDALVFKNLRTTADFAHDKLTAWSTRRQILPKVNRKINTAKNIREVIKGSLFGSAVKSTFTSNGLARMADQVNPLEMMEGAFQTTVMGPGGIQSERSVSEEAKLISDSHFGFLDPVHTPEGCFDSATEVFTSEGWVRWAHVTPDTSFACLIDGRLEFHRATELQEYEYSGKMYGLRKPGFEYLVTPNHRMLCRPIDVGAKYRVVRADEMHGSVRAFKSGHEAYLGLNAARIKLPHVAGNGSSKNIVDVDFGDWAEFLGWYLSEGSCVYDEEKSYYHVSIFQSEVNSSCCRRIEQLLDRLGFTWCQTDREHGRNVYTVATKQLAWIVSQLGCRSFEKRMSGAMFSWPLHARYRLIDAMMLGDGRLTHTHKRARQRGYVYTTTSAQLSTDVERMIISLGWAASTKVYEDSREKRYLPVYETRVLIHKQFTSQPSSRRRKESAYYTVEYTGTVYCATVPGSFLYVRRNKKAPIWLGNSKTGVTLHLPLGVTKEGNKPTIPAYNTRTGRMERIDPVTFYKSRVALPDQVRWQDGKPVALGSSIQLSDKGNEVVHGSLQSVDYVMRSPSQLFSTASNLIPWLGSNSGNRASYADTQMKQAISLKHREAPLVQVGTGTKSKGLDTFEGFLGSQSAHVAPVGGTVTSVSKSHVVVRGDDGKERKVALYNNFPLNDPKAVLDSSPIVKVGQKVERGQVVADNNFTRNGALALGTNLRVAYLPYKGQNFEDGVVISRSAANKLTSVHMHKPEIQVADTTITDTRKFRIHHPEAFTKEQIAKVGDNGVVHVGQRVMPGDPLVLATRPYELGGRDSIAAVRKSLSTQQSNASLVWKSDFPGEVVGVHRDSKGNIRVHVRTEEPMQVGDKLTGRAGNKGIVTNILEDHEMPRTASGHLEVLLNPAGIPGRMNMGQVFETVASKIARQTGKPYIVHNFEHGVDQLARVKADLAKHGIPDQEEVHDPISGKSLGKALVGEQHLLKLNFQVDKKVSARAGNVLEGSEPEHYDNNLIPAGGGKTGAQSLGNLAMYSMLAHGARANIREMQTLKSEGPDTRYGGKKWDSLHAQTWRAIQVGDPIPTPKKTFAFQKFEDMLRAAGVDVVKKGHRLQLTPLTSAQVLAMSSGEIKDPASLTTYKLDKSGEPEPTVGGLFDPKITGGHGGRRWSHMTLAEPMPNPVFEGAIQKVLGMGTKDYAALVNGDRALKDGKLVSLGTPGSVAGGAAIAHMLGKLDTATELGKAKKELDALRLPDQLAHRDSTTKLDQAYKRVRYLQALHDAGITPKDAYTIQHLPILPPAMRPASVLPDGSIKWDDVNGMYKRLGEVTIEMRHENQRYVPDTEKRVARAEIYDGLKALMGVGTSKSENENESRGLFQQIAGVNPKRGYFQGTLLKRRQDMTMRGTITPDARMGLDSVGLPQEKALTLFRPFVVRKLVEMGYAPTPLDAQKMLTQKSKDKSVYKALDHVMEERPVLLKRDPSLHMHSIQAFKPHRVPGKSIVIHPLVTGGFGADFDGDSCLGSVLCYTGEMAHEGSVATFKVIDLAEFPRIESSRRETPGGVVEYDVPAQVYVPAYKGGAIRLFEVTGYSVHPECEEWLVTTRAGREIRCSSDHSLALLSPDSFTVEQLPPRGSVGLCLPIMRDLKEGLWGSIAGTAASNPIANKMVDTFDLTCTNGWFIGVLCGDGWVSGSKSHRQISLSSGSLDKDVVKCWEAIACHLGGTDSVTKTEMPHEFEGVQCFSARSTISSTALGNWLLPMIGHGARGKHLPERFLETPVDFRRGLFLGLIDTDGTACWSAGSEKKKPQFSLSFTTTSERLANEVVLLGLSLGISSSSSDYVKRERPVWIVTFSIPSVKAALSWLKLVDAEKQAALDRLKDESVGSSSLDIVPVSPLVADALLAELRKLGAARKGKNRNNQAFTWYTSVKATPGYMLRDTAQKVLSSITELPNALALWASVVRDESVGWDIVESASPTGEKKAMYDLTVPEALTFTLMNGAVVWDTMAVYVPLSPEAVREAHGMLPSNNLYNAGSGKVEFRPSNEAALGLYKMSRVTGTSPTKFKDPAELLAAARDGKIAPTVVASVGGMKTTAGRVLLANELPEAMQKRVLEDHSFVLDKKGIDNLYTRLAKDHRTEFADAAAGLMRMGYDAAFGVVKLQNPATKGTAFAVEKEAEDPKKHVQHIVFGTHSFGLDDFTPEKGIRQKHIATAQKKIREIEAAHGLSAKERERRKVEAWYDATEGMLKETIDKSRAAPTNFMMMNHAGLKPTHDNVQQLRLAPMMVVNAQNQVKPRPIMTSYSEGLSVGDYWTQQSGARRGSVLKVQEVTGPGAFTKQLMNTAMGLMVDADDCGTSRGVSIGVEEKDIYDRILASDTKVKGQVYKAGTILTPDVVGAIRAADKSARLEVRSPLKCEHGTGLCQKCAGLAPNGSLFSKGTNLGVIATQSMGERSSQLTLKAFHSGGIAKRGPQMVNDFKKVVQLTELPRTIPNAARLAMKSGTVEKIENDPTGVNVWVGGVRHHVPKDSYGNPLWQAMPGQQGKPWQPPKVGMHVAAGQPLSDPNRTDINPHDLYRATGSMEKVQNHLVNELHSIFGPEGVRRQHIETVVKAMSNLTRVTDPGDVPDVIKGEFTGTSKLSALNRDLAKRGLRPALHTPVLKGIKVLPLEVQEDWMAKLNHNNLKNSLAESAATGASSYLHGTHPVPGAAYGAEFGLTEREKQFRPHLADVRSWHY